MCGCEGVLVIQGAPAANSRSTSRVRVVKRRLSATPSALMTMMNFLSITLGGLGGAVDGASGGAMASALGASGNSLGCRSLGAVCAAIPLTNASRKTSTRATGKLIFLQFVVEWRYSRLDVAASSFRCQLF